MHSYLPLSFPLGGWHHNPFDRLKPWALCYPKLALGCHPVSRNACCGTGTSEDVRLGETSAWRNVRCKYLRDSILLHFSLIQTKLEAPIIFRLRCTHQAVFGVRYPSVYRRIINFFEWSEYPGVWMNLRRLIRWRNVS
ncbi:hypothetical protein PM082_023342 [Marasmius tenuissimus]|nr:hypothetical protein PM082_023342 [Marasmius tenuissimus]